VYFQSLDMDPLSNIIVGGSYGDTNSMKYAPLVGSVTRVTSQFRWLQTISNTETNHVIQVKLRNLKYDKAAVLMMDSSEINTSVAILNLTDGSILKVYRKTPIISGVIRGPEVAQVKSQSMLYSSNETIYVAFRDNKYRNGFFSFSDTGNKPSFVQIFNGTNIT
jgi:hypothetical protein